MTRRAGRTSVKRAKRDKDKFAASRAKINSDQIATVELVEEVEVEVEVEVEEGDFVSPRLW